MNCRRCGLRPAFVDECDEDQPLCVECQAMTCPTCGRPVYRYDSSYWIGAARYGVPDPTLRHSDDGSVAVMPDGTPACSPVAA